MGGCIGSSRPVHRFTVRSTSNIQIRNEAVEWLSLCVRSSLSSFSISRSLVCPLSLFDPYSLERIVSSNLMPWISSHPVPSRTVTRIEYRTHPSLSMFPFPFPAHSYNSILHPAIHPSCISNKVSIKVK